MKRGVEEINNYNHISISRRTVCAKNSKGLAQILTGSSVEVESTIEKKELTNFTMFPPTLENLEKIKRSFSSHGEAGEFKNLIRKPEHFWLTKEKRLDNNFRNSHKLSKQF